jgi:hypothetical protein
LNHLARRKALATHNGWLPGHNRLINAQTGRGNSGWRWLCSF